MDKMFPLALLSLRPLFLRCCQPRCHRDGLDSPCTGLQLLLPGQYFHRSPEWERVGNANPECPALMPGSAELVSGAAIHAAVLPSTVIPSCPGAGIGLPAARRQCPSPLISCNLQDTAQPAQSRGLLKQNPKEGSSKCHVGTGQG